MIRTAHASAEVITRPDRAGENTVSFNPADFELPSGLGLINNRVTGNSGKTVIHIQDAHCNYNAQHKIADIMDYLTEKYGINIINLEGGTGAYDLSVFEKITDKNIREQISDKLVSKGILNGAEYFAINKDRKIELWGIESPELYKNNLDAYRNAVKNEPVSRKYLAELSAALNRVKEKIYTADLLELDRNYTDYTSGKLGLKEFVKYLAARSRALNVDLAAFTNITHVNGIILQEEKIDFDNANKQRKLLIREFQNVFSRRELRKLAVNTIAFKNKETCEADFYGYLAKKAGQTKIPLGEFGDLSAYMDYSAKYAHIDKFKIADEISRLVKKNRERLFLNARQKQLNILSDDLDIMLKIFEMRLVYDDFMYYRNNPGRFKAETYLKFLREEQGLTGLEFNINENIRDLDGYLKQMARFYEFSLKRDNVFFKNIRFTDNFAIVYTGGFHSGNLKELFKKHNIDYISVVPEFEASGDHTSLYLRLLSGVNGVLRAELSAALSFSLMIASPATKLAESVHGGETTELLESLVKAEAARLEGKPQQEIQPAPAAQTIPGSNEPKRPNPTKTISRSIRPLLIGGTLFFITEVSASAQTSGKQKYFVLPDKDARISLSSNPEISSVFASSRNDLSILELYLGYLFKYHAANGGFTSIHFDKAELNLTNIHATNHFSIRVPVVKKDAGASSFEFIVAKESPANSNNMFSVTIYSKYSTRPDGSPVKLGSLNYENGVWSIAENGVKLFASKEDASAYFSVRASKKKNFNGMVLDAVLYIIIGLLLWL
ncbi:MAG: hypothetical protein ABH883_00875, partial [Candidatus Omnitrophota bacterium]